MDLLILHALVGEWRRSFEGGCLADVFEESADRFRLRFDVGDRRRTLFVALRPSTPWIGAAPRPGPKRPSTGKFAAVIARAYRGAVLRSIDAARDDRRVTLGFVDGRSLVVELNPQTPNLVAVDPDGTVRSALRLPRRARERLTSGARYEPPPVPPGRVGPWDLDPEELDRLAGRFDAERAIAARLVGTARSTVRALLSDAPRNGVGDWWRRTLEDLASGRDTACVVGEADPESRLDAWEPLAAGARLSPWTPAFDAPTYRAGSTAMTVGVFQEALDRSRRVAEGLESAVAVLRRESKRLSTLIERVETDLSGFEDADHHRRSGEAILAGLSRAERVGTSLRVPDPYRPDGAWLTVPLKPGQAATDAADAAFARHRRALRGRDAAERRIDRLARKREAVDSLLESVEVSGLSGVGPDSATASRRREGLEALEGEMRRIGIAVGLEAPASRGRRGAPPETRPRVEGVRLFRTSTDETVLVGRSSKDNHRLTFKLAAPEDFWLHALERTGAHVVVRNPERRKRPDPVVLEEAAAIAAWYSEARSADRVDVQWTRRKYVRKMRNAPPGAVILKRFETVRVRPALPAGGEEGV